MEGSPPGVIPMIVRDVWRHFRRDKLTATMALSIMAFGFGTSAVTLSVVDGTFLHPLPYSEPGQIVEISQRASSSSRGRAFTYQFYYDFVGQVSGIEAISPLSFSDVILDEADENKTDPSVVTAVACSTSLLDVLQVSPLRGRFFDQPEEIAVGSDAVAVISEELWRSRYASDPNIVGKAIRLNEIPFIVIGVMKAGLRLPPKATAPGVWIPLGADPLLAQVKKMFATKWERSAYLIPMWARIAKGYAASQVEDQVNAVGMTLLAQDDPGRSQDAHLHVTPVEEQLRSKYALETKILILAALLVLSVSCFNVSSLIGARTLSRRAEVAVRLALGASVGRVARHLVFEGLLISVLGALAGITAAAFALEALGLAVPNGMLPYREIPLTGQALVITLAASCLCGIGTSIWSAFAVARVGRSNPLEYVQRSSTEGQSMRLTRQALVAAQIGCAALALVMFLSLFSTYRNIRAARVGFDPDHVLVANLRLPQNAASGERWKRLGTLLPEELANQEGVLSAAVTISAPFARAMHTSYKVAGGVSQAASELADYQSVGPDYFAVLGVPILKGRQFSASDGSKARPVCVINEALARADFIDGQEIGATITLPGAEPCEVVGVVGDTASYDLRQQPQPTIYVPFDQTPGEVIQGFINIIVRTSGNPSQALQRTRIGETTRRTASALPVKIEPLASLLGERSSVERFRALLMGAVSIIAVVLAACGIYGATANYVLQKRRDVTIRLALGATAGRVILDVLKTTLVFAAAGLLLGLSVAYPLLKTLSGVLFGFSGLQASTVALCALSVPAISSLSGYIPARRILRFQIADVLKDV